MEQLAHDKDGFDQCDIEVIIVCPENKGAVEKYIKDKDLPFIFIHDEKHELAKEYQQQVKLLKQGRLPLQLLMDETGEILYQYYSEDMKDITSNETIFNKFCK